MSLTNTENLELLEDHARQVMVDADNKVKEFALITQAAEANERVAIRNASLAYRMHQIVLQQQVANDKEVASIAAQVLAMGWIVPQDAISDEEYQSMRDEARERRIQEWNS